MSSFLGRVTFEGDKASAEKLLADAVHLADKLSVWKQSTGLDNVSRTYSLGDDNFVVINDLEHLRAIHIVAPSPMTSSHLDEYFPYTNYDNLGVMDVIHGKVGSPTIVIESVEVQRGGETVVEDAEVLKSFTPTNRSAERYSDLMIRRRLGVKESPIFADPNANPEIIYSEHAHIKPTCYSGSMRKLIQFLLGVGKVVTPTWEERWIDDHNSRKLDREIRINESGAPVFMTSPFGLYHETNQNTVKEVQVAYDYRAFKTHGVTFDNTGKPWIIQVASSGVHVMPLYLDPISVIYEGRQRYLDVSPELTDFFDEFGGFPLGVPFPTGAALQAYVRAGEVVELISSSGMQAFYGKITYSSATGWCFNSKGTLAYNTCYNYDATGVGVGYMYRLNIEIGGETLPDFTAATGAMAAVLGLSKTYEIKKARRTNDGTAEGIVKMAQKGDLEGARSVFNDLVVDPTLNGVASITLSRSGNLYHPAKFKFQPQIKFSEPVLGGLMSHDFGPMERQGDRIIKCNTPMYAFFVGDSLEVVYYFYDPRKAKPTVTTDTREACQYVGGWEYSTKNDNSYALGHFYTARWDFRDVVYGTESKTLYKGKKVGENNHASAVHFFAMCVNVVRIAYYHITHKSETISGRGLTISIALPINDRCGYYLTRHFYETSATQTEGGGGESLVGNVVDKYVLYNFVFHWFGQCGTDLSGARCIAKKVTSEIGFSCFEGAPDDMFYMVCPEAVYANTKITIAASWGNSVIGSAAWPHIDVPSPWSTNIRTHEPKHSFETYFINDSGHGPMLVRKQTVSGKDQDGHDVDIYSLNLSQWWWRASPDDNGSVCHIFVTHSCLGSNIMNYQEDIEGNVKHLGGPAYMEGSQFTCYTGIID